MARTIGDQRLVKVLVCGYGSIGRRHVSALQSVAPTAEVVVVRREDSCDGVPRGVRVLTDLEEAASGATAAIIATPATIHKAQSLLLAEAGVPTLVEKPMADVPDAAEAILSAFTRTGTPLQVGYCLRFDRSARAFREAVASGAIGDLCSLRAEVGQWLPSWRPQQDYRESVTARTDLGGGALLELSHELDLVSWVAGPVRAVAARLATISDLEVDVEDTADLLIDLEHDLVASVHLDLVQRPPVRIMRAVGTDGTVTWDGIRRSTSLSSGDTDEPVIISRSGDPSAMYVDQLRHFLDESSRASAPAADGAAGLEVVRVVGAARRSSMTGRWVKP